MKKLTICILVIISCFCCILTGCSNNDDNELSNDLFSVSFEVNGGSEVTTKKTDCIIYSPTTIKEGYNFDGWYFDKQFESKVEFPLSVDLDFTLYAKWKKTLKNQAKDFETYVESQTDNKIVYNSDDSTADTINTSYAEITCIGSYLTYKYDDEYTNTNGTNRYSTLYSVRLSFDYGNFLEASGYINYYYYYYQGASLVTSASASYRIISVEKSGSNYIMNGFLTSFTTFGTYNHTEEETEITLKNNFVYASLTIKYMSPLGHNQSIFDYE